MPSPSGPQPSSELIERLQRQRTGLAFMQGIFFLFWQTIFLRMRPEDLDIRRAGDHVTVASYLIFVVLFLVFLARLGGVGWSRQVRAILNDETTREHRRRAIETGFWAAMGAAFGCFAVLVFRPFSAFAALHIVLSAGLAAALMTFAWLEWRAQAGD